MQQMISVTTENIEQRASGQYVLLPNARLDVLTDRGGRAENQDAWGFTLAADGSWVIAVADGLGGHLGGRIAAQCAIEGVLQQAAAADFNAFTDQSITQLFHAAQQGILARKQAEPALADMRSTLVVLVLKDDLAIWGHIGDVRLYQLRNGRIMHQTRDQSVPQMLADMGEISPEQIRNHPDRSRLLQALGKPGDTLKVAQPKMLSQLEAGDCFVLATDGFWELVDDDAIAQTATEQAPHYMQKLEQILLSNNEKEPEYDNYTFATVSILHAIRNEMFWRKTAFVPTRPSKSAHDNATTR